MNYLPNKDPGRNETLAMNAAQFKCAGSSLFILCYHFIKIIITQKNKSVVSPLTFAFSGYFNFSSVQTWLIAAYLVISKRYITIAH